MAVDTAPIDNAAPGSASTAPTPYRRRWAALAVIIAAEIMDLLDGTVVNVAAPDIRLSLGGGLGTIQWVLAAYSLAMAVGLIIGGRLGDVLGRRRMFLIGAAGFTAASALCAAAVTPQMLIGGRVLQGLLGAVMIPQGLGLIRHMFKGKELAAAFAAFGPAMGLAAMAGPLLGGWLVEADLLGTGWRSIFGINLPVGAAVIVAALVLLPENKHPHAAKLDLLGGLLAASGAFLAVYPLVQGRESGWPAWTFVSLGASAAVFAVFALLQRRRRAAGRDPLVEPALFRRGTGFSSGVAVTALFFGAMIGFMLIFNLFTQMALRFTAFEAGLALAPWSLGTAVGAVVGGSLVARLGRRIMHLGLAVMFAGLLVLWLVLGDLPAEPTPWTFAAGTAVCGVGMGAVFAPLFAIVLGGVGDREIGGASGLLSAIQQFGGAAGAAGLGTVFFEIAAPMTAASLVDAVRLGVLAAAGLFAFTFLLGFLLPRRARTDVH